MFRFLVPMFMLLGAVACSSNNSACEGDAPYDGCNTCTCVCANGTCSWQCTLMACLDIQAPTDGVPADCLGRHVAWACCAGVQYDFSHDCCNDCWCNCDETNGCGYECTLVWCDCGATGDAEVVQPADGADH